MKIYIGSVGSLKHHEIMKTNGWGMMLSPAWRNPKDGFSWALDNGAYSAWINGKDFDSERFIITIDKIPEDNPPDFIILPDIVAAGKKSLLFSYEWIGRLPSEYSYYLAVQDGVIPADIIRNLAGIDGIFIGGTMAWKIRTGEIWVRFAHDQGISCHIGRVGTYKKLFWANRIRADSIDSSTFVQANRGRDGFQRILKAAHDAEKTMKLTL